MNRLAGFIQKNFQRIENDMRYFVVVVYEDGDCNTRCVGSLFEITGLVYAEEAIKHFEIIDLTSKDKHSYWSTDQFTLDEFSRLLHDEYAEWYKKQREKMYKPLDKEK
jgi:sulfatase maturation enzyme AslB (radical SAM superfamily)